VTHAFGHHHIDGNVGVCNVCFHGERGIPTPSPSPREGRPSGEGGKIRKKILRSKEQGARDT
jgi:hypothetical protein